MVRKREWRAGDPLAPANPLLPSPVVKTLPPLFAKPDSSLLTLESAHGAGHDGAGRAVEDPSLRGLERRTALGHAAARVLWVGGVSWVTHALVTSSRVNTALVTRSWLDRALIHVLTLAPRHQGVARVTGAAVGALGVGAHLGAGPVLITLVNVHTSLAVMSVARAALTPEPRVPMVTVTPECVTRHLTLPLTTAGLLVTDGVTLAISEQLPLPTLGVSSDALPRPLLLPRAALLGDAGEGARGIDTLTLVTN